MKKNFDTYLKKAQMINESVKDNGWNGANYSEVGSKCKFCDKTKTKKGEGNIRVFHYIAPKGQKQPVGDDHIHVCADCAKTLDANWYGCGCGG